MQRPAATLPPPGLRRSYWLREALAAEGTPLTAPPPTAPPPTEPGRYDVVVIGGGYTGLWTAFFLTEADPGIRIAIVEQDVCGGGPSGRNGGFLHGWWDQLPRLVELHGPDRALEVALAADEAVDGVRAFCEAHGVDAWYRRGGYLRVSAAQGQDGDGLDAVAACRRLGVADQLVAQSAAEVQARCASPAFRGGVFMPNAATIQPARLARGLRRVLLERGVTIHEGTPASSIAVDGRASVLAGDVRLEADHVVLAVNAWAAGWPEHRRSVLAWGSYMVLTEPAPEALAGIGWTGGEAIADARFTVHYFRTTPDGRVAFDAGVGAAGYGGRIGASFERDPRAVGRAAAGLDRLLPALADVPIAEAWGGPIDISADRLPIIGSTHGGRVHHAYGFAGNGVGPARLAGRVIAARIATPDDPVARLPIAEAGVPPLPAGAHPLPRRARRPRGAHPSRRGAAEEVAREIGVAMSVAVVDSGGQLVAFERMDGADLVTVRLATDKVWTALVNRMPTGDLPPLVQPGAEFYGYDSIAGGRMVVFAGGLPLERDGVLVGGVGVSGGSVEEDRRAVEAATGAFAPVR